MNATSSPMTVVKYTRELEARLRNVASLPHGGNCKFLTCIRGEGEDLVAKQWTRQMPKKLWSWEVVVAF